MRSSWIQEKYLFVPRTKTLITFQIFLRKTKGYFTHNNLSIFSTLELTYLFFVRVSTFFYKIKDAKFARKFHKDKNLFESEHVFEGLERMFPDKSSHPFISLKGRR